MTDHERLSMLRELGLRLRSDHEFSLARIPPLTGEVIGLSRAGLIPPAAYCGDIILCEPYEGSESDTGRAYLAVLTTTRGFGIVQLDTEERLEQGRMDLAEIERRFVAFDELPARIQARMGSQIRVLLDQLLYDLNLTRDNAS